jgi:hypothetical protein
MAAGGTPANVVLGPGRLYYAPLGTTEPVSASAALPSAWKVIGYTEAGTTVTMDVTSEAIEVAEEFDPIRYVMTRRETTLAVELAEATVGRLALALGAGAAVANDGTAFEFPDPSAIVDVMFVWDSDETPGAANRRWIFRQARPSGSIGMQRAKAPQKTTISVNFQCAKTSAGLSPVKIFPNATGQV